MFGPGSMTPEQFEEKMRLLRQLTDNQARLSEGLRGEKGSEGRSGADGTKGSTLSLNYNGAAVQGGLDDKTKSLLEANAAAASALASFSDAQRREVWALVGKLSDRVAELEGQLEGAGGGKSLLTQVSFTLLFVSHFFPLSPPFSPAPYPPNLTTPPNLT